MINEQTLHGVVKRLFDVANPSVVIVFGSYGRGKVSRDSDLDILVIKPKVENQFMEMVWLRDVVGHIGVGVDMLVYSDKEFERRSRVPGTLLYWARKEGRMFYGSPS